MSADIMEMPALGRPFTLGMLYDARREKLIPGFSLFGDETLQQYASSKAQRTSAFEIIASDSIESKSSVMDIGASLSVSFLGGLVEVGGSAKYLNDSKKFQNQSRVTLKYKATTTYQQFTAPPGTVQVQQTAITDNNLATHVVTGILYGANAFFVFDSDKLEKSNLQDIQGKMEVAIRKIPTVTIEGSGFVELTDEEKSLASNLSCKFHGDFILESLPTTFEDAVTTYQKLPQLLGEEGASVVPMKVWLVPLKKFYSQAELLVREITVGRVRKIRTILEDVHVLKRRVNEAIDDKVVQQLPLIHDKITFFQQIFQDYIHTVQEKIATKLPLIREGTEDESSLDEMIKDRDKSPFSNKSVSKWLDAIETEINVLKACAGPMEGTQIKFVSNQTELDREVLAENAKHAVCFVFTSMERRDPYLRVLAKYLESPTTEITGNVEPSTTDMWCYSPGVIIKMKQKAKAFSDLAKTLKKSRNVRFLAAAITNGKYQGATMYHYKEGSLETQDFTFPKLAPVETIKDKSDLLWYACDITFNPNTANKFIFVSDDNKFAETDKARDPPGAHPERFEGVRQVMCKEGLTGRHYWEVEWFGTVCAGLSYSSIVRKGGLLDYIVMGFNLKSWAIRCLPERGYSARHYEVETLISKFSADFTRLGVFLDHRGGTLSFYKVSSNVLHHMYTFKAAKNPPFTPQNLPFTEPLYPIFLLGFYDDRGQVKLLQSQLLILPPRLHNYNATCFLRRYTI